MPGYDRVDSRPLRGPVSPRSQRVFMRCLVTGVAGFVGSHIAERQFQWQREVDGSTSKSA